MCIVCSLETLITNPTSNATLQNIVLLPGSKTSEFYTHELHTKLFSKRTIFFVNYEMNTLGKSEIILMIKSLKIGKG